MLKLKIELKGWEEPLFAELEIKSWEEPLFLQKRGCPFRGAPGRRLLATPHVPLLG
jgi:hypothetical protein